MAGGPFHRNGGRLPGTVAILGKLQARSTPALDAASVAARDLARYYALLDRERPGTIITPDEACLIRDALPEFRAARRGKWTLELPTAGVWSARSDHRPDARVARPIPPQAGRAG